MASQGSPLSPILYLLVIQSFISLINTSPDVEGISVPGIGGDESNRRSLKAGAFADDLNLYLRNTDQLTPFRALLAIYENASGAVNSWPKTFGLRVGTLRGSDVLPDGWVEGRDINTKNTLIKYLGMFLGAPADVAKKWEEKVTSEIITRYNRWIARGVPRSHNGRNMAIRNHVNSVAWYLVQAQTPPNLPAMLTAWRKMAWQFFEAPANVTELSDSHRSAVSRLTLIQDYQEGGQRCQDIELVARSLYQRQIGRLVAPSNHQGIDLVMSWVNKAYGHLRMGRRLLHSSCDFLSLPHETPNHWRLALKSHGTLRGLVPYVGSPEAQNDRTPETIYRHAEHKGVSHGACRRTLVTWTGSDGTTLL